MVGVPALRPETFSRSFPKNHRARTRKTEAIKHSYCNPYSGNEKGAVENAVGFLRRNLLVPVPRVGSLAELNALLREGCDRLNASSRARDGRPTPEALSECV